MGRKFLFLYYSICNDLSEFERVSGGAPTSVCGVASGDDISTKG